MKAATILIIAICCSFVSNSQQFEQKFSTTDIDNFWKAYDKVVSTKDTALQKQYLSDLYINKGTEGLKALMQVRRYSLDEYRRIILDYPKFWASIRPNINSAKKHFPGIRKNIDKLRKLYPELQPSPIYFVIGAFRTNGTIDGHKVLIGAEQAMSSKKVDISEVPDFVKEFNTLYNPISDLEFLCTHEYIHTQQKPIVDNLLTYCIYEGIPEFLATVVTGKQSYVTAVAYAEKNPAQVRTRFEEEMFMPSKTFDWLWSANKVLGERDLGYGVGYLIAKGYYEKATDKKKAVKEMIGLDYSNEKEVENYVDQSGFFSKPLEELYTTFQARRPFVSSVSGIENGSKQVKPGKTVITFHFSEALNGHNTGVDYGEGGAATFPKLEAERIWSADKKSWQITAQLEPNKHYQILISNNFRLGNGTPLKAFLVEFWTTE